LQEYNKDIDKAKKARLKGALTRMTRDAKREGISLWRQKVNKSNAQNQLNQALAMNQASTDLLAQTKDEMVSKTELEAANLKLAALQADLLADTTLFELTEARAQLAEERRQVEELITTNLVQNRWLKAGAIKLLRDILGKFEGRPLIKDMLRRWHAQAVADELAQLIQQVQAMKEQAL